MQTDISIFIKFVGTELINPLTYLIAFLIGAAINTAQGNGMFFSAVPYVIPLFVQAFAKASIKFKGRDLELLCQLPGQRNDPAFVIDLKGRIIASQGNTKNFFKAHRIEKIHDIFEDQEAHTILKAAETPPNDQAIEPLELYSEVARKWYQVQTKVGSGDHILIWLDEISSRKALDLSLAVIRQFSDEVINSINDLVRTNDIYDRLARLILGEGYQGVFITREDREGNLAGYVFKGQQNDLVKSDLIRILKDSPAPIWDSRKTECDIIGCVASATKPGSVPQEEFERTHPFDERVKNFLNFAITNYINYHEGDVSIIAFNKDSGIKNSDFSVMETVVNTARSITYLIDLAIGNNRMLSALELAEEVQQNLLPQKVPTIKGLDIAARSNYCNKTGGDYYDFLNVTEDPDGTLNVVVGDVAGHGIAAGLLMTTARALIRSRSAQSGSLSQIVTEVNRNLTLDIAETNRFMTLFYLSVDRLNQRAEWVRAGHDPALLYNPVANRFEELYGPGLALGLDENHHYEENEKTDLAGGQIIFLGTDGIWEAVNPNGELFGKRSVRNIIRQNAVSNANEILESILAGLIGFRQGLEPEDDVTLVIVKIEEDI
jgi:hypothetical protein